MRVVGNVRRVCRATVLALPLALALGFGDPPPAQGAVAGAPILGESRVSVADARSWARTNGATPRFESLAALYWELAPERGVRAEVAYAQAAKETGFGRFSGVIDASFRNPCGLKRTNGGGNYDPRAHQRFSSWRGGVSAHLDHLALYAGAPGFPRAQTPDPRHFASLHGRASSIEGLGGAWAPSPEYGRSLTRLVSSLGSSPPPTRQPREARTSAEAKREQIDLSWRGHLVTPPEPPRTVPGEHVAPSVR